MRNSTSLSIPSSFSTLLSQFLTLELSLESKPWSSTLYYNDASSILLFPSYSSLQDMRETTDILRSLEGKRLVNIWSLRECRELASLSLVEATSSHSSRMLMLEPVMVAIDLGLEKSEGVGSGSEIDDIRGWGLDDRVLLEDFFWIESLSG